MLTTIPNATFHEIVSATIAFEEADHLDNESEKRKTAPTGFSSGSNQCQRFVFQPVYHPPYHPPQQQSQQQSYAQPAVTSANP
jgi:hypothetical protein